MYSEGYLEYADFSDDIVRPQCYDIVHNRCIITLDDDCVMKGYVWHQRKRDAWKRYWCILRKDSVMEFYAASEDKVCKWKVVLISYEALKIRGVEGLPDMLEISHKNQVMTTQSQSLKMVLKGDTNEITHNWYNAVKSVLIDFEDAFCCNESSVTDLSVTEFNRSKF
ncbi:putative PH domain protein [Trichinella spiralis]|uniref:putative PH domain protein n=1 Tax=Trichinella spiralis TaxID=6334 RepID=UPI0001EFE43E|nr:putative PH domain protein [Trichinella spiralis]